MRDRTAARERFVRAYDHLVASSPVPVAAHEVTTASGTTHVLTAGDPARPPLLALHGASATAAMYAPLLATLTRHHRVLAPDILGNGNRSVPSRPVTSRAQLVTWLGELLDAEGIGDAVVVGTSLGAWLATSFASDHADRVRALGLVAPGGVFAPLRARFTLRAVRYVLSHPTEAGVARFLDSTAEATGRDALRTEPWSRLREVITAGLLARRPALRFPAAGRLDDDDLARLTMPVLLAIGDRETATDPVRMVARARAAVPHARIEVLEGANHLVNLDHPEPFDAVLASWLAEVS